MLKIACFLSAVFSTVYSFDYADFQRKHCYEDTHLATTAYYFPYDVGFANHFDGYVCENFSLTNDDLEIMSQTSFAFSNKERLFLRNCEIGYFNEILVSKFPLVLNMFFDNCKLSLKIPQNYSKPTFSNNFHALGFHNCVINDNLNSSAFTEFVKMSFFFLQNTTLQHSQIDEYLLPKRKDMYFFAIDNTNVNTFKKGILSTETVHDLYYITCTSCHLDNVDSLFSEMNYCARDLMSFANNKLTKLPSSSGILANCSKLESLNLSNNSITEPVLTRTYFKSLRRLQSIDLSMNTNISTISFLTFVDSALERLNMSNVNLEFLEKFGSTNLISIDFSHNKISDIGLEVLELLINLNYLNISHNRISKLDKTIFRNLGSLLELRLNSNCLRELPKELFRALTNLQFLDLSCNPIITTEGFENKRFAQQLVLPYNLPKITTNSDGCNGTNDCTKEPDQSISSGKHCTLLQSNGLYAQNTETTEIVKPGGVLKPGNTYNYKCPHRHILIGVLHDVCINGKLLSIANKNPPICLKSCSRDVLQRASTQAVCKYKKTVIDCNDDIILPGTTAEFQCQFGYIEPAVQINSITCLESGEWDNLPYPCAPMCGTTPAFQKQFIYGGYETNIANVPWQAAIYKKNAFDRYEHICGGSIVTAKLIVTAAHCLWDRTQNKKMDPSFFSVAVGKTRRDYYIEDTDYSPQFSNLSDYQVGRYFEADSLSFINDIAVLILNNTIIFKKFIVPICWDRGSKFKEIASNLEGTIAGWGRDETGKPSGFLKFIALRSISNNDCQNRVSYDYKSSIVADKFCVSSDEQGSSLCDGDSGGGFAVERESRKYYLEGVVSTGLKPPEQECGGSFFVTLTSINHHIDLISDLEKKFRVN